VFCVAGLAGLCVRARERDKGWGDDKDRKGKVSAVSVSGQSMGVCVLLVS